MNAQTETLPPVQVNHYEQSYWEGKGRFQATREKLFALIPTSGPCLPAYRALERLRVACNCYYDLFNNGLDNRASEFRGAFGFSPKTTYPVWRGNRKSIDFRNSQMNLRMNLRLDLLIVEAAIENGIAIQEG